MATNNSSPEEIITEALQAFIGRGNPGNRTTLRVKLQLAAAVTYYCSRYGLMVRLNDCLDWLEDATDAELIPLLW